MLRYQVGRSDAPVTGPEPIAQRIRSRD